MYRCLLELLTETVLGLRYKLRIPERMGTRGRHTGSNGSGWSGSTAGPRPLPEGLGEKRTEER